MPTAALWIAVATLVGAGSAPMPSSQPSSQEDERGAVLEAVQSFFDAMAAKDVEAARKVLLTEGSFFSVRMVEGEKVLRSSSLGEFLEGLPRGSAELLERMWEPQVMVHRDIAMVWTPYDFHIDGEFSHCGIDLFNLVKTPEGWKISGGSYTVERSGCPESPLPHPMIEPR